MAPLTPVLIVWEDAHLEVEYDGKPEKATSSTVILHAIGWLVRQTRKEVVIAMDLDPSAREIRFTLAIPRKMVLEIRELERKNATEAPKEA